MKKKNEFLLLSVVIIAILVYLVFHKTDNIQYQLPETPLVSSKKITKLQIIKPDKAISLSKRDSSWFVEPGDFPADLDKVKKMVEVITGFTLTDLVSESKNYVRYDLTDDKKVTVKALSKDVLKLDFEIGKPASSRNHTFVKLPGDPNVYHCIGDFRNHFNLTVDDLRDKTIFSFDVNEIREIALTRKDKTMVIVKKSVSVSAGEAEDNKTPDSPTPPQMKWEDSDGKEMDQAAVQATLSSLSDLKCKRFLRGNDLKKPDSPVLIFKLKGAKEYTLKLFEKKDEDSSDYPGISSESSYPFLLTSYDAEKVMKDPEKFWWKK